MLTRKRSQTLFKLVNEKKNPASELYSYGSSLVRFSAVWNWFVLGGPSQFEWFAAVHSTILRSCKAAERSKDSLLRFFVSGSAALGIHFHSIKDYRWFGRFQTSSIFWTISDPVQFPNQTEQNLNLDLNLNLDFQLNTNRIGSITNPNQQINKNAETRLPSCIVDHYNAHTSRTELLYQETW